MTRKMEFLLAHENGTWSTRFFDVPEREADEPDTWAALSVLGRTEYRKFVYCICVDSNPDLGRWEFE